MSGMRLSGLLSAQSIVRINNYLYGLKDEKFIIKQMKRLVELNHCNPREWELLVRDSQSLVIQLPNHQLSRFNFAYFIESFIIRPKRLAVPYFEQICMQMLKNNPNLIENRYYVGNGGSPAFQLIVTYLVNRSINGTTQLEFPEIVDPLFRILNYVLQSNKQFVCMKPIVNCLYNMHITHAGTTKTEVTYSLILSYFIRALSEQGDLITQARLDDHPNNFLHLFKNLFDNYGGRFSQRYRCYQAITIEEYRNKYYPSIKKTVWNILIDLDQNNNQVIRCFSKEVSKALKEANKLESVIELVSVPSFKQIIFSTDFICDVFSRRDRKWCEFLWSCQQQRQKLCEMQKDGRNLLESVCDSRGLVHNIVSMLWESGLFDKMPEIRNKKSKAIIQSKYSVSQ